MNLAGAQELLWRLITAPEGVAKALQDDPADAARLAATVAGEAGDAKGSAERAGELTRERRLDVYAEAYFARIHDALESDFSDLAAQLGEPVFHDLVTSYLAICPPRRPSLRDVGERLPEFLARGTGGEPFRRRAPWAAALAALEWQQADLFDAPDAAIATRRDFETLPAEQWEGVRLELIPASALLTLDWPVHTLCESWPDASTRADASEIAPAQSELLVWRAHESVSYRPLPPTEAEALAEVAKGTRFGDLCRVAAGQVGEQKAPEQAASWLARWLQDGVLTAPTIAESATASSDSEV